MAKLKVGAITDDKPVKLTVELPAAVHRDLLAYAKDTIRTCGLHLRRVALYPAELRVLPSLA